MPKKNLASRCLWADLGLCVLQHGFGLFLDSCFKGALASVGLSKYTHLGYHVIKSILFGIPSVFNLSPIGSIVA